jgi:arsenical pump membrane protein
MWNVPDLLIWILSLACLLCVLLRPWGVAEAWWACGGAGLLILTGLCPFSQAGAAILKGVDVYLFLAGMMMLAELARETGVFDWIAEIAGRHANGSARRLFLLVYLTGVVVTAFLSNDATAVVLTPAILAIVRRLRAEPKPYLLACAFISNAASFILPISNPANLVIFDAHLPALGTWLRIFLAPALASVGVTYLALRWLSRRELRGKIEATLPRHPLSTDGRLALGALGVAAAVLITASLLGWPLGAPTCGAAVIAVMGVACRDRKIPGQVAKGVSWSVIPLVAGLFVLVEALESAGMLRLAVEGLEAAAGWGQTAGNLAVAFGVGLLSNGMNNLPVGLISGTAVQALHAHGNLGNAVLIGVDLGPNLSVSGSLATILWLIALRREKVKITGWQFFQAGLVVMPTALLASILVLGRSG